MLFIFKSTLGNILSIHGYNPVNKTDISDASLKDFQKNFLNGNHEFRFWIWRKRKPVVKNFKPDQHQAVTQKISKQQGNSKVKIILHQHWVIYIRS